MSKKPVPKKKQAVSSTRSRHSAYVYKARTRLSDQVQLVNCPSCGAKHRSHFACPECGYYRGKAVVKVKTDKAAPKVIEA